MATAGTLAIDLGSSTTVVAFQPADGSAMRLLAIPPYSSADPCVVPSLLWLSAADGESALIGRQVVDAGLAALDDPRLCRDFKRWIGAPLAGSCPGSHPSRLEPEQAGRVLLTRLWAQLPDDVRPSRLVLTAPVEHYQGYRQWLESVSAELDVEEVALVDEPTAAAIGAGLAPGSRVLVVDLGGGTFDLSLVELQGGEGRAAPIAQLLRFAGRRLESDRQTLRCARVLGKAGIALGGRDIDRWIAASLCPGQEQDAGLLAVAEQLKCALSEREQAIGFWSPPGGAARELRLDHSALDALLRERGLPQLLDELLERVLAAGRADELSGGRLDAVLPVGGTSRLPTVRGWLQERFATVPLRDERPIEAVALGALALTPGVRVKDVLSRGVSLRCWDRRSREHRWHPLFLAGQSWPTDQPLELVLACSRDGQRQLELVLGEPTAEQRSEVVFVDGLPRLRRRPAGEARVEPWAHQPEPLNLEPPGQAGVDRLRLRFAVDAGGALVVAIHDLLTDRSLPSRSLGAVR